MSQSEDYQEIREIADAICDENVSSEQLKQLELLLSGNSAAKQFYLKYLGMHVQLSAAAQDSMEFVYRRMTEELIFRPGTNTTISENKLEEINSSISTAYDQSSTQNSHDKKSIVPPTLIESEKKHPRNTTYFISLGFISFTVLFLASLWIWYESSHSSSEFRAEVLKGNFSIVNLGEIDGNHLYAGEYYTSQDARLILSSGETIQLKPQSQIKFLNKDELELKKGAITIESSEQHKLILHGPRFSLNTESSTLSLDLRPTSPVVKTGIRTLLTPHRWRPAHYWSFEGETERAIDSAGNADGIISAGATKTKGLLGQSGYFFDNTYDARINVGSGGGVAPATGSFAVTDGVTIEALIAPNYSAETGDMDEIFRKDQSDKELRMLLSFQQDPAIKPFLRPRGVYKESLSFGLYLVGQGYQELKLPLDGLDGRPTLSEINSGKPYHVVASYDVASGLKAIYINGEMLAHYHYPAGSKMLSGGSGAANIGNSPNLTSNQRVPNKNSWYFNEAFSGVIDEVAFYDFALPPFMVKRHYQNTLTRNNYFGLFPNSDALPQAIELTLPDHSAIEINSLTGLPNKMTSPGREPVR